MDAFFKKSICGFLVAVQLISMSSTAFGINPDEVDELIAETGQAIFNELTYPIYADENIGLLFNLNHNNYDLPNNYAELYGSSLADYIIENYDENARPDIQFNISVAFELASCGINPYDIDGINLFEFARDVDAVIAEGKESVLSTLITLNTVDTIFPDDYILDSTRHKYLDFLLNSYDSEALNIRHNISEIAQLLLVFSYYPDYKDVKSETDYWLSYLSKLQTSNGTFSTDGNSYISDLAMVLVALQNLDIDPNDPKFTKGDATILDGLMEFSNEDDYFSFLLYSEPELYGSLSAFIALNSYKENIASDKKYYDFSDVEPLYSESFNNDDTHKDINVPPVTINPPNFLDMDAHKSTVAITELYMRGIVNGISSVSFAPDDTMTRAQFTAIVVRALGLTPETGNIFTDVSPEMWYAPYVDTAFSYEIISGRSEEIFSPDELITRQEAVALVSRTATLCGFDIELSEKEIEKILEDFSDTSKVEDWALPYYAFCIENNIIEQEDEYLAPRRYVLRSELTQMIYNVLFYSNLL